jgi:ABC-type sugar transport system substrate-binding protein
MRRCERSWRDLLRPIRSSTLLLLVACSKAKEAGPTAPAAPEPPRIAIALGESIDGLAKELRDAAHAKSIEVLIAEAHGHSTSQSEQVGQFFERKIAALLVDPVVPDLLHRFRATAAEKQVPMIGLLRGDGRVGSWVGIASSALAKEAGERAGAWLKSNGCARPRVVVIEDARWPETTRRVEATLEAIEAACGGIDLPLRLRTLLTPAETSTTLLEALGRLGRADVLVAGDRFATEAAVRGARESPLRDSLLVVGTSDDPELAEAARAPKSRLLLVAWKRDELVRLAIDAAAAAIAAPTQEVSRAVPCELIGLEVSSTPKGGW